MLRLQLQNLLDADKCYSSVRELRWPDGVQCPHCYHTDVIKKGFDETEIHRRK
ncbi:MAG: transposase, partial [SAR324 cluster bacterium]|nr:transposase [SAR324 cluster bacterium]